MLKYILGAIIIFFIVVITGIFIWSRTASRPENLGVTNGQLAPCPDTPNCVTTQQGNPDQQMEPLRYTTSQEDAQARLVDILEQMPRSQVITNQPGYIAVEYRSPTFGFPDDTEFVFDAENNVIHFRSAARLGRSDLGVNRERMEDIRQRFAAS